MVVSGRRLGLLAAVGLLFVALPLTACGSTPSHPGTASTNIPPSVPTARPSSTTSTVEWMTTSSYTLFPSQLSFMQELSGDGYQAAIPFTDQEEGTILTVVWIVVDPDKVTRATYDAIFDQAVALAKKYGAADSTGGRLRVELSDAPPGEFIKDYIIESRDFSIS